MIRELIIKCAIGFDRFVRILMEMEDRDHYFQAAE
jgi:hypothetical protein